MKFLREISTGICIKENDDQKAYKLVKSDITHVFITKHEFYEYINIQPITAPIFQINSTRRIYATVSQKVFRDFINRCKDDCIQPDKIGEAFAKLVELYANGAMIMFSRHANQSNNADYLKDKK